MIKGIFGIVFGLGLIIGTAAIAITESADLSGQGKLAVGGVLGLAFLLYGINRIRGRRSNTNENTQTHR